MYAFLYAEHEKVDLFLKSKVGEVKRRLEHLGCQTSRLDKQRGVEPAQKRMSVRRVERYSQLESDLLRVGEVLQSLSTFATAQRTAFSKLLKEYKRWTGSSRLETRLRIDLFQKSDCLAPNFSSLLSQHTKILAAARASFDMNATRRLIQSPGTHSRISRLQGDAVIRPKSFDAAAELYNTFKTGSGIETDIALSTLPLSQRTSGYNVYWIHHNSFVQVCILLQQYVRVGTEHPDHAATYNSDTLESQKVGSIVCDNLGTYVKRWRDQISNGQAGSELFEAAATIRYTSSDAIAVIRSMIPKSTRLNRQSLRQLFESKKTPKTSVQTPLKHNSTQGLERVQDWIHEHQEVQPLVQITCQRTRLIGLANTRKQGIWVSLDQDASFSTFDIEKLDVMESQSRLLGKHTEFPHAILTVRWEGQGTPELVKTLHISRLVDHVPGFSLEEHAVTTLLKRDSESGITTPFWCPLLEKDICKDSSTTSSFQKTPRRSSAMESGLQVHFTSTASATDGPSSKSPAVQESLSTSVLARLQARSPKAFRKKGSARVPRHSHPLSIAPDKHSKYWNEFDDGEEAPSSGAYTILVNPNEPDVFSKIVNWFHPSRSSPNSDCEQQSLLATDYFAPTHPTHYSSNTPPSPTTSPHSPRPLHESSLRFHRDYSTFAFHHQIPQPKSPSLRRGSLSSLHRHRLLLALTTVSFATSFLLAMMAGVLESTRRKRYVATADVGALVGVGVSILFASLGLGVAFAIEKDLVGWLGRVTAMVAFALALTTDGIITILMVGE